MIPSSVTSIEYYAFAGHSSDLVISGYTGSEAEAYANNNDIPFIALDAPVVPFTWTVNGDGESVTIEWE